MIRKAVALAIAVGLLAPSIALALNSYPASPLKISLSGTQGPTCTTLTFRTTGKLDARVVVSIGPGEGWHRKAIHKLRFLNVRAGKHSGKWCGLDTSGSPAAPVQPGTIPWSVQAQGKKGGVFGPATKTRSIYVVR